VTSSAPQSKKAALRDRARVVAWGVALVAASQAVSAYLAQNHVGAVIAQLVIAEFGTGRLGVAWSDPLAAIPTAKAIGKRALRGASMGASAAVVLVGASVITRTASLGAGELGVAPLVVGLLVAMCTAARDELLLRGLVLRALGANASLAVRLGVCGLAGAAFRFGVDPSAPHLAFVFALLSSIACAALWTRDRGAWLAVSANAAFAFVTGPVVRGSLLDVRSSAPLDGTPIALVCGVFLAVSAVVYARRKDATAAQSD
jgi:hypothetical protein